MRPTTPEAQGEMNVEVRASSYDAPVVQELVQDVADDLARFYGPAGYPPQDASRWSPPDGIVLVAYLNRAPVACGGFIRFDPTTAELKRMFTRPRHRGRGIASLLLAALEDEARLMGYRRMVLETGRPQADAVRLYERAGYTAVPCWPPYDTDPVSVCMGREIGTG